MLLAISISKVLEYYAIFCLTLLPLNFFIMIYLSRRTHILERIDQMIDRLIPLKEEKAEPKKESEPKEAKANEEQKPAMPSEKEIQQMSGVAAFEIMVGEKYQCHLNFQNRGGSYGEMDWYNDNEFVGKIKQNGVFTGQKVGRANIFCASRGHSFDSGAQAYCIDVVSRYGNWFADNLIKMIKEHKTSSDVFASYVRRKVLKENSFERTITYGPNPNEPFTALSLQYDELQQLVRGVYTLPYGKEMEKSLVDNLNERFEEIKLKNGPELRIWIHQVIDNEHEEVDIYAVLYKDIDGELRLGIGLSWREYGEKQEFKDNITMATRLFQELMNVKGIVPVISKEKPDTVKRPKKKPNGKNKKDAVEEKPVETTEEEKSETVNAEESFENDEQIQLLENMKEMSGTEDTDAEEPEPESEPEQKMIDDYPDMVNE